MNINDNSHWFVKINKPINPVSTIFCCHYGGGSASVFRGWEKFLPENIQIVAIQLPGRETRFSETPISSLTEVVEQLSEEMYPSLIDGKPYSIFGHSIGGLISFELVRRLSSIALPEVLIVSAAGAPQCALKRELISNLPDKQFIEKLKAYNGLPDALQENEELLSVFMPMLRADLSILEGYRYHHDRPIGCPILALGGIKDPMISLEDIAAWCVQTNQLFTMRYFNGDHFFIKNNKNEVLPYLSDVFQSKIKFSRLLKESNA